MSDKDSTAPSAEFIHYTRPAGLLFPDPGDVPRDPARVVTITPEQAGAHEIRALHQHVLGRGPCRMNDVLAAISEGLRYGHTVTVTVGTPDVGSIIDPDDTSGASDDPDHGAEDSPVCEECGTTEDAELVGDTVFCPSCLHDAERAGWTPGIRA